MRDGGSCASEVCGTVAQSCVGRRKRAVRCKRRNAGLERRRCAVRWELCETVALVVGEDEGWPEKVKARRRSQRRLRSLHNEGIGVF